MATLHYIKVVTKLQNYKLPKYWGRESPYPIKLQKDPLFFLIIFFIKYIFIHTYAGYILINTH